jgi:UPF0755 protein
MSHPGGPSHRVSSGDDPDTDVFPRLDDNLLAQFDAGSGSGQIPAAAPAAGGLPAVAPGNGLPAATAGFAAPSAGGGFAAAPEQSEPEQRDAEASESEAPDPEEPRVAAAHPHRRRRAFARRARKVVGLVTVVVFCSGALAFAAMRLTHWQAPGKNFSGPPGPTVVIQVHQGDTADQIAQTMVDKGVVETASAFYKAAVRNSAMPSLQPGYYAVPSHITGERAVGALLASGARVGDLVLSEGRQLLDSHDATTGALKDGIYTKIAEASCYGPATARHCVTHDQLLAAGAGSDLDALGVPSWATDQVRRVPDHQRQLEGLIAAGTWDFDPTASPTDILRQLVSASAAQYQGTALLTAGPAAHLTPYQMLVAASLVEREALPQDMPRVARVIFNRLAVNQPLEFDSTVNYDLPETAVATTDQDRARATPWNTYAQAGLPATPIASPSLNALKAVESPAPGPWLYFVTVDKQGDTLFTADYQQHLQNIKRAEESGILDRGPQCPQSGCPR